jgi:hypothetical protein
VWGLRDITVGRQMFLRTIFFPYFGDLTKRFMESFSFCGRVLFVALSLPVQTVRR